ncbi:PREDICTED: geranylgeranyl transferase type-2 subunit alpha 2-like [Camelina sativa]|uniref:Geranylgeranyl transferase type-2 subunit alpha n=1 Tax=Camelina sativa TaxID=90675 RepID=A0ABM0W3D6_CAMSA|nr:PREDICTED: geranylgeranyl transferase type-2 subunit alpha 2-like [Camelina sativa]
MHGRPRKAASKPAEEASKDDTLKLRSLQSQFMSNHHQKIYTQEAIQLSAKLLENNPEAYTAWNYRKLAVEDNLSRIDDSDPSLVNSILNEELEVVAKTLRKNLKSYGAWYHRKWVLSKGHSSFEKELQLLNNYQTLDLRNFHAWNYRSFVVELTKTSEQDELQYTTDMINDSFSNYSAWHNRSLLLSSLVAKMADGFMPKETIRREFDYVHNAIFTDEGDQSAWFYYLWLLDQTVKLETPLRTSSWPSNGSIIILSGPGCFTGSSSKFTTFCSESGSFPLILYFDQAVSGVNSSTVTVDSELKGHEDLVWEPVSDNNSQVFSCVWVARLEFDSTEPCSRTENKVKVSLGKSPGIVSSRGCNISTPYEFIFTVHIHDTVGVSQEGIVSWTGGGFDNWDAQSKDLNSLISLNHLNADTGFEWRKKTIKMEIECFRDLPDSKFGKLILARLLMAEETLISDDAGKGIHYKEILQLYNDLMALDSSHDQYYKDELSVALLHKVTSSTESLSRHLFRYRNMNNIVCLRLNNLTLSRMAAVEKLLFVQMLDLSHNELHSADGLETMQLLCCLNLSHNRIRSFSALGSLRLLKQLSVLDVSHNNIAGKHPVDTTRYLCSSPLSNSDETGREVPSKYWDAYLVLGDLMKLKQLDIRGNDLIAGEEFSSLVRQVVPKLVWLDGHKLAS